MSKSSPTFAIRAPADDFWGHSQILVLIKQVLTELIREQRTGIEKTLVLT